MHSVKSTDYQSPDIGLFEDLLSAAAIMTNSRHGNRREALLLWLAILVAGGSSTLGAVALEDRMTRTAFGAIGTFRKSFREWGGHDLGYRRMGHEFAGA